MKRSHFALSDGCSFSSLRCWRKKSSSSSCAVRALAVAQSSEVVALVSREEIGFSFVIKINRHFPKIEFLLLESIE